MKPGIYLVYGAPGAGKTTVFTEIADHYNFKYLSVGQLTRAELRKASNIGKELQYYLNATLQYPPKLISRLILTTIEKTSIKYDNVILDGFPKYPEEGVEFNKWSKQKSASLTAVINLTLPLAVAWERIRHRRICMTCGHEYNILSLQSATCPSCNTTLNVRDDDSYDAVVRRYQYYTESYQKTLNVLRLDKHQIHNVDATNHKEDIISDVKRIINTYA